MSYAQGNPHPPRRPSTPARRPELPETSTFILDGRALAVHHWGGVGRPVLLAHATGFHGLVWAPVAERLMAAGRRVWSFDFRGHGRSDRPADGAYAWSGFGDDVFAVADHLGLTGDPELLAAGHSAGTAALFLAEAGTPGSFARIWAYEPISWPSGEPRPIQRDHPMSVAARKRRDSFASPNEAYANYASKPPLNALHPDALRAYVDGGVRERTDGTWELRCRPNDEAEMYAMSAVNGVYEALGDVRGSVRIVCGKHTGTITPEMGRVLAERLPRGELEVMPLGHFGPLEDPDAAVASMLDFAAASVGK